MARRFTSLSEIEELRESRRNSIRDIIIRKIIFTKPSRSELESVREFTQTSIGMIGHKTKGKDPVGEFYRAVATYELRKTMSEDLSDVVAFLVRKENSEEITDYDRSCVYRFVRNEICYLQDNNYLKLETEDVAPEIERFNDQVVIPQSEDSQATFKDILETLEKKKYMRKGTSDTLSRMLFPQETKQVSKTKQTVIEVKEEVVIPSEENYTNHTTDYLINEFGLPAPIAQSVQDVSITDIDVTYHALHAELSNEDTMALVKSNPDVLRYNSKGQLGKFMRSLLHVKRLLGNNGEYQDRLRTEPDRFSSIESLDVLKSELAPKKEEQELEQEQNYIDAFNGKMVVSCPFLHKGNNLVEKRLDNLIENGEVYVGSHEHWTGKSRGSRGHDILKRIQRQIIHLFSDLGLPRPETCEILDSDRGLRIDEETQNKLREIKPVAYSLQRD
ncbi:hypothetical protein HOL21_03495 [Candidatus Woesearchaeota archaeon]|jgi:hypothetical protein|nr:hypothetical protein [Candidatus Woesearchaeota archaeon]MBT5397251.1 hypothetical protein [Candidatus Woesearchaeota archaeon]MBT6367203.1 hypothetical protein [Candidatus Woesearchaeota archaeon]MBT7762651.1 hypothetical protein [Candidatus Woesearchaeota archaeon]